MVEPRLNRFCLYVNFRQRSLCWSSAMLLCSAARSRWMLMDVRISMSINQLSTAKPSLLTKSTRDKNPLSWFLCLRSTNRVSHCRCALTSIFFRYKIKLDSDERLYGGHGRLDHNTEFFSEPQPYNGRQNSMQVHVSSLTLTHQRSSSVERHRVLNMKYIIIIPGPL